MFFCGLVGFIDRITVFQRIKRTQIIITRKQNRERVRRQLLQAERDLLAALAAVVEEVRAGTTASASPPEDGSGDPS